MSIDFSTAKKNIFWDGKGPPTRVEKEAESARLIAELTEPIINYIDIDSNPQTRPNPNYVGDLSTMNVATLQALSLKSEAQKELCQRIIDVKKGRVTVNTDEYLGESGFHKRIRTIKRDTDFVEITRG